jgi:hypothetical protein
MITKKDMQAIAEILKSNRYAYGHRLYNFTVDSFANWLATENPRFNREKFNQACGRWMLTEEPEIDPHYGDSMWDE